MSEDWLSKKNLQKLDTAKLFLKQDVEDLVRRTDLEEETILDSNENIEEFDS
jgi:N utilization substance protein A